MRQFFRGNQIDFYTTEHAGISAIIDSIKRDSIFLVQYDVKMLPNRFGTFAPDTLGAYKLQFSLQNIYSFPAQRKSGGFFTNGALFGLAGSAYLLLNIINTSSQGDKVFASDNMGHLALGAALIGTGLIQHLVHLQRQEYVVGKKYQLKYLPVAVKQQ